MENHTSLPPTSMDGGPDVNMVGVPRLNSVWPYSVPHYRNHYQETSAQPVSSSSDTVVSTVTSSAVPVVNSVPIMGTLQTVLTTGVNPSVAATKPVVTHTLVTNQIPTQTHQVLTQTHQIPTQTHQIPTQTHQIPTQTHQVPSQTHQIPTQTHQIPSQAHQIPSQQTHMNSQPSEQPTQILTRGRLQDLVREVDPNEQLDEDVEDILLNMADDFVESAITAACLLAKHRKSNTVEVKDLQLHLERNWNMWIPGFGTDELRPYKRSSVTEAHKQRLTLIRKTLKKY